MLIITGYIMENVSHVTQKISSPAEATKRPSQHVLSLYHKYKGSIYLAFDSALEKDKWLEYFHDAHRRLAGTGTMGSSHYDLWDSHTSGTIMMHS